MTLIIWKRNKNNLIMSADRKIVWWFQWLAEATKIIQLWETLIWISWHTIDLKLIQELYNEWIKHDEWKQWFTSIIQCMKFISFIKENSWLKEPSISVMILNKDVQVLINPEWYIENFKWDYICSWSWSAYAYTILETLAQLWADIPLDKIIYIVSKLDDTVWISYDILKLNID